MTHFDGTAELGCLAPAEQTVPRTIQCNKRPKGRSCPGYIEIQRTDVPPLRWQCSWCEDAGLTHPGAPRRNRLMEW